MQDQLEQKKWELSMITSQSIITSVNCTVILWRTIEFYIWSLFKKGEEKKIKEGQEVQRIKFSSDMDLPLQGISSEKDVEMS